MLSVNWHRWVQSLVFSKLHVLRATWMQDSESCIATRWLLPLCCLGKKNFYLQSLIVSRKLIHTYIDTRQSKRISWELVLRCASSSMQSWFSADFVAPMLETSFFLFDMSDLLSLFVLLSSFERILASLFWICRLLFDYRKADCERKRYCAFQVVVGKDEVHVVT